MPTPTNIITTPIIKSGVLVDKLACIVVLSGDRLLDLPVVAQGGEGFRFCLLALRAGQCDLAGKGAGGVCAAGLLPIVLTGRGDGAGAVDQVVDCIVVGDGVPFGDGGFLNGDVFVSIGDGCCIAGFQGHLVTAVRVVIAPVYDRDGLACCGV